MPPEILKDVSQPKSCVTGWALIALVAISSHAWGQGPSIEGFSAVQSEKAWAWDARHLWLVDGKNGERYSAKLPPRIVQSGIAIHALSGWFFDDHNGLLFWIAGQSCSSGRAQSSCQMKIATELTVDAGASWTYSESAFTSNLPFHTIERVDFVDHETGWAVLASDAGAGQLPRALLQTKNGGRTWNVLYNCANEWPPTRSVSCENSPEALSFYSRTDGILIKCQVYGEPVGLQLYRTKDGGKAWIDRTTSLPHHRGLPRDIGNIVFESERSIVFAALFMDNVETQSGFENVTFRSDDNGATWSTSEIPKMSDEERLYSASFFADSFGITLACTPAGDSCRPKIFLSRNRGKSWFSEPAANLGIEGVANFGVVSVQKIGATVWMQIRSLSDQSNSRLSYSSDNGQHWRLL